MSEQDSLHRTGSTLDDAASKNPWDVLIIGGGITGAGILLDAVQRGLKAILIEMQDFAEGTSSRSTKLVHGGLRYLKQFEIGLVAEVGKERRIVYENAPHVTTPEWMLLPLLEGGSYGVLAASFGIRLYDYLAGVKRSERRQMLSREQTLHREPLLRTEGLKGAGTYVEYRTDDARLTLEIIKEAVARGGTALNYTKATRLQKEDGRVIGVEAQSTLHRETMTTLLATRIINATGPWVDVLREMDGSKQGKTLHWTKGVHLVVDASKFPLSHPVYFDVPDGRMIFAIPRDGKTYIGTTDTDFHADLLHPRMTVTDRDYLLDAVQFMFPSVVLSQNDVESSWAGVRPLIHEAGKNPSEISRKDEVFESQSGLITIAGGKLTGYRKMAEKVVDLVTKRLSAVHQKSYPPCQTEHLRLSGGHFSSSALFASFIREQTERGVALGLSAETAEKLVRRYGSNITDVFSYLEHDRPEVARDLSQEVYATLQYGMDHEMVCTPSDYFVRRTASLYFNIAFVREWMTPVVAYMAQRLGWTDAERDCMEKDLQVHLEEATVPVSAEHAPSTRNEAKEPVPLG